MSAEPEAQFSLTGPEAGDATDLSGREKLRQVARQAAQIGSTIPTYREEDFLESLLSFGQAAGLFGCSEDALRDAVAEKKILAV
jgi:hypothetical protein